MTDNPTVTLLTDAFGRVRELVQRLTDGLDQTRGLVSASTARRTRRPGSCGT